MSPDEALALVIAAAAPLPPRRVPVAAAVGAVLAADLVAAADLPPFDRAMMDGFAVRLADAGRTALVGAEIAAGHAGADEVKDGSALPIMTGAPVPPGAQAVVPIEATTRDGDRVRLPERIRPGANIVTRGAECRAGATWAAAGTTVTPLTLAAAIGVGLDQLPIIPRPRTLVLTTGDELTATAAAGGIRDSNGPMLVAMLAEAGLNAERGSVGDRADDLRRRLEDLQGFDAVVLTGGVSAGTHDEVPGVLRALGAEVVFHHVAQRPGKPFLFARLAGRLIFALPGNPLAAHLCAGRYAIPALRRLAGWSHRPRTGRGPLTAALPANGERTWFLPARVAADGSVVPLPPVSSADLVAPHQADAWVRLNPGAAALPAGTPVDYTRFGGAAWAG